MLDHVLSQWGSLDEKIIAARHRVFARDGWRSMVPGCTSMQNLHDHHIRFRSAGGTDALETGARCVPSTTCGESTPGSSAARGAAPDGLRWEMGIRP